MTLLDATATLIDTAKTFAPDDPTVRRAVKRMERRLLVLQIRKAKTRKRIRWAAFCNATGVFGGGVWDNRVLVVCRSCNGKIDFKTFLRCGTFDHRAQPKTMTCPHCGMFSTAEQRDGESEGRSDRALHR